MHNPLSSRGLLAAALILLTSCVGAGPRFPSDVSASLRDSDMRRLDTESLTIYYPSGKREVATRFANRVEACADRMRQRAAVQDASRSAKMVIVMPDVAFNNAYVQPAIAGLAPVSVVPTFFTLDFATEFGLPPDPAFIGCHEIAHYVQFDQVSGFWRFINRVFGNVLSPQIGLDSWFAEGLAVYIETTLQPRSGRLAWPVWRGMFHAGVAGKSINGGDLSDFQRRFHAGNHYLIGSHFVAYLVDKYGEDKLWELVRSQGSSFFFPFAVNRRFSRVYGKSLSGLIDEFAFHVTTAYPELPRPGEQRIVRRLGSNARYARANNGTEAIVRVGIDDPPRLEVYDASGLELASEGLVSVLPPNDLVAADPLTITGLSFTADGNAVYFAVIDLAADEQTVRLCRYDIASDELSVVMSGLRGTGGSVSGDGTQYFYANARDDRHELSVVDLQSKQKRVIASMEPQVYVTAPRPSPNGKYIAMSVFNGSRFVVWVVDAQSGERVAELAAPEGHTFDPSFADERRVVYLSEVNRQFQVFVHDLKSGTATQVTRAPYLAFNPQVSGNTIRFLNRDGWRWTLDEVAMPDAADTMAGAVASTAAPVAASSVGAPGQAASEAPNAGQAVTKQARILSDEPYSSFDGLFRPQLHSISVAVASETASLLGISLGGADRLGFHSWSLSGFVQLNTGQISGVAQYANSQLAPWTILASASQIMWDEEPPLEDSGIVSSFDLGEHRQRDAVLAIVRPIRTTTVGLLGQVSEHRFVANGEGGDGSERTRRLAGPGLFFGYQGVEATGYGIRRALGLQLDGAYFPAELSTLDSFFDLRGQLDVILPMPLVKRHRLQVTLRGRGLFGLPDDSNLLQVGGAGAFAVLFRESDTPEGPEVELLDDLPAQIQFVEPLRGFEDFVMTFDRVAIAEARYWYPLVIDRGFATSLWILPAFFIRQIDLEAFGTAAAEDPTELNLEDDTLHAAVGGSITLRTVFWRAPLALRYQLAQRLSDDEALVHSILLGAGI